MSDEISYNIKFHRGQIDEDVFSSGLKWQKRFIKLAAMIGSWSKEPNTQVGCVIVDSKRRIVSTGYNGFPRHVVDDESIINDPAKREEKLAMTIHAEENALLFAGRSVEGCHVYITHPPCSHCAAKLIQAGVKSITFAKIEDASFVARWGASVFMSMKMAQSVGVTLIESTFSAKEGAE